LISSGFISDVITLVLKGKAAHGSTPQFGINAATKLAEFLNKKTDREPIILPIIMEV